MQSGLRMKLKKLIATEQVIIVLSLFFSIAQKQTPQSLPDIHTQVSFKLHTAMNILQGNASDE